MSIRDHSTEYLQHHVIVIGAGLAGMVAALSAHAQGAAVVLIDRSDIGLGSNSAMSNGRFSGPTTTYSADDFIRNTLRSGKMINHRPTVGKIAHNVFAAFHFMRSTGLEFQEKKDHYYCKVKRLDVQRGVSMTRQLAGYVKTFDKIRTLTSFYVTEILQDGSRAYGVRGITKGGETVSLLSPSVILATGGAGAIYFRNDNQKSAMGQGYYLAARAGLSLWDMEFVQFYPVVIAEPRLPSMMIYPPYPKTVGLITASGKDLLQKYGVTDVNEAMRKKRDALSQILYAESLQEPVYMDLRNVSSSDCGSNPLQILSKMKFDFQKKPVRITPGAHFFMGGLHTNEFNQTDLKGLYACGEICWGLHGANRFGGNALTECLVTGMIAGRHAAESARRQLTDRIDEKSPIENEDRSRQISFAFRPLQQKIREISWDFAGIIRNETGLKRGLQEVKVLENQLDRMAPETVIERRRFADLAGAVFVLKTVLTASLARKESRGAFVRKEYPMGDNIEWRKNSSLTYDPKTKDFSVLHRKAE